MLIRVGFGNRQLKPGSLVVFEHCEDGRNESGLFMAFRSVSFTRILISRWVVNSPFFDRVTYRQGRGGFPGIKDEAIKKETKNKSP